MALLQLCVHGAAASDDLAFAPYTDLKIDTFSTATLPSGGAMHYYRMWLSSQQSSVKVILLPLKGDADALVSFDRNATAQRSVGGHGAASWRLQGHGVEELLLRPEVLCRLAPTANNEEPAPPACYLYARVRGYYDEGTTYMFGVLDARNAFSVGVACAPGCGAERLSNLVCDAACNVTACAYDRGACVPQLAAACSPGCQREWLADVCPHTVPTLCCVCLCALLRTGLAALRRALGSTCARKFEWRGGGEGGGRGYGCDARCGLLGPRCSRLSPDLARRARVCMPC
jgi:hypothetical protein